VSAPVLGLFLRKELRDLRGNPQVYPGYLLLPLIAILLPAVFVALLPTDPARMLDPDLQTLLRFATRDPLLAAYPEGQRLVRLIIRDVGAFFLLMPVMLSAMSAALAIAAEKQQRTLEPILATTLSDREFLLAKLIAALGPAVLVTWGSALLYLVVIAAVTAIRHGTMMLPGWTFLPSIVLLAPLAGAAAALMGMRASARARDVQSAVQTATLWVVPAGIALAAVAGRAAMRSPLTALIGAVVLAGVSLWLFRGNLVRFRREEILTRWS